ncbi:phage major capsid protein [Stenotrophomonas maltophilia group sp. Smal32]|uniref:phage major capsid protein n=1 Tax=Stenotrophomonas maltophilia group sp. Smal32 TaxID=3377164 RepID=UPI002553EE06|nr:phage major capsid protein [Stenotrophomonas maltophilia]
MAQIDDDIKNINASLGQVNEQLKKHAEQAKADINAHAKLSEETKAKVDQLLVTQGELQANLQAAQQVIAKLEQGGGVPAKALTIGEVVAASDACKNFNPGMQGSFTVKAAITRDDASAGTLIQPQRVPGIVATPNQRLFLRDLLTWGTTTSDSIEYVRETGFTNNADVVAENPTNPKPESDLAFELDSAKITTIAHWIRASKQVLRDAGQLQAYINGRLMYGLKLKEEAQLLKGSGVGLNINGLYTQATAYANPGVTVQNETAIDRLRIAMLQVTLASYEADGIVLNPIDWTTIELSKTTENAYLFATPRGLAVPGLWARPVVATKAMDLGDFLTGAFKMGAQGWDREQANITVSNQDRDNFVKNMVTILCEEDVGLTVFRPEAFVKGGFDGLPVTDGAGAGG